MYWLGGPGTIYVLIAFVFAVYAQGKVKSTYSRYARISNSRGLADLGILFFLGAVIFQIVTLPVEFNASSRALAMLGDGNYLSQQELGPARAVLQAAALTYVAAAAAAIAQLLRLLSIRRSRD